MDGQTLQNKRLSSLFKDIKTNKVHYLNAIVWKGEDEYDTFNGTVGGVKSSQYVKFPFIPKTFYIDVYRELYNENNPKHKSSNDIVSCGSGDYVYFIKNKNQLKEVAEYYDGLNTLEEKGE